MAAVRLTSSYCVSEFRLLQAAVIAWDKANDFFVDWNERQVKGMSQELADSIEKFLNNTADANLEVAPDARADILAIDRFYEAYVDFKTKAVEENPAAPPYGSDWLWREYRSMIEHFDTQANYPKPLPIKKYTEQNVGVNQIAIIFGWKLPDGTPDVNKVAEELETPGTHYNPETWVHPAKVVAQSMVDRDWAKRKETRQPVFDVDFENAPKSEFVPPPLDEMIRVGAPPQQIARVHGISIDEAEKLLIEAGTLQGRDFMPAGRIAAHMERNDRDQREPVSGLAGV